MEIVIDALRRFNWFYRHRLGLLDQRSPSPDAVLPEEDQSLLTQTDRDVLPAYRQDLEALTAHEKRDLVQSLARIEHLLAPQTPADVRIRPARSGEVSLIAARQSALYAESHGWGHPLECLIAETAAQFLRNFKPDREACWVAELDGLMAGAVFLTDEGSGTARLRLLHVEPFARRRGVGDRLVQTCLSFARDHDYERVILWTHTVLETARRLYARNGFSCIATAPHDLFGMPLQGEDWECQLHRDTHVA